MALCFVALAVFAVLGIFSARHRKLAAEAFDCVFRKTTFRRCNSNLDQRLRTSVTGKFLKLHPSTGRFVYRHFSVLSWIFTALFIISIVYSVIGVYNFTVYGNCNGLNDASFCVFDPAGHNTGVTGTGMCIPEEYGQQLLTLDGVDMNAFLRIQNGGPHEVVFIGCYACPFTHDVYETVMRLADREDVAFSFGHYPTKDHRLDLHHALHCVGALGGDVRAFNDILFRAPLADIHTDALLRDAIAASGVPLDDVEACTADPDTRSESEAQIALIEQTNLYGTPLVFINDRPVVGPRPYRVYWFMLNAGWLP